jgi:polysaccharide biosynthesis transport protein
MSNDKLIRAPREGYPEHLYASTTTTGTPDEQGTHLLNYWRILVTRRWTVLAVLLTAVTATAIWTFKQTPIYRSTVSLQIDRENQNVLSFKDVYQVEATTDDALQTQFKVLASRSLARRVIQDLHLDTAEEFRPTEKGFFATVGGTVSGFFKTPVSAAKKDDTDGVRPLIDAYIKRLDVSPVRLSRLVNVSFESKDPELAARVMNAHAKYFIEQNLEFKWEATQQASDFLSQQLVSLKANLEKAEDKLQEYSRANQIMFTEDGKNTATEKLLQLETEYTKAQAERFQKESYDRLIRSGNRDSLPQLTSNLLINTLESRLAELQREESALTVTFAPEYPKRKQLVSQIKEIDKAIQAEKDRVVKAVEADYTASVDRESLMARALEDQGTVVNNVNQNIIQYNILKREVDSNKQLYDGLLTRLKEAGVSAGLRASNIRIVDRAEVPHSAVRPQKLLNLSLGIVVGLLGGIGASLFQEYIDNTIKTPDDIARYFGMPILGAIPALGSLGRSSGYGYSYASYGYGQRSLPPVEDNSELQKDSIDLISHVSPQSLLAEGYRSVRTSLLLSSAEHPPRSILVSSAAPGEGKTATAVNTAISLAQTGARVVLVDTDMRRPRIHSALKIENDIGLSGFLSGTVGLKDVIKQTKVPNLCAITCGSVPPNPAELMLSRRLSQMTQVLSEYFDFVVFDSPPICNVSDARVIAPTCDTTIFVVKACSTSRHLVKQALVHLLESNAHIAGIVLNQLDKRSQSSHYSYYSGAYYYSGRA